MIDAGSFREDLYYRMNGLVVRLPSLRERSDLAAVARRILASECPNGAPQIGAGVMALFERHPWPGNVRQLANVLRTAAAMAAGEPQIAEQHLSDDFFDDAREVQPAPRATTAQRPEAAPSGQAAMLPDTPPVLADAPASEGAARTLEQAEIEMMRSVLEACGGNISEASKRLGVSRNTIYRRLRWPLRVVGGLQARRNKVQADLRSARPIACSSSFISIGLET